MDLFLMELFIIKTIFVLSKIMIFCSFLHHLFCCIKLKEIILSKIFNLVNIWKYIWFRNLLFNNISGNYFKICFCSQKIFAVIVAFQLFQVDYKFWINAYHCNDKFYIWIIFWNIFLNQFNIKVCLKTRLYFSIFNPALHFMFLFF